MKKLILILTICTSANIFADGFRNVEWMSNIKTIKSKEKGRAFNEKTDTQEAGRYSWDRKVYNFQDTLKSAGTFDISYILIEDKLIQGKYSQKVKDDDLGNYKKMKKILEDKYGKANGSGSYSSYSNIDGKEKRQEIVESTWYVEDTKIDLQLINGDRFEILYTPIKKEVVEFLKESGLKKERAKEKELLKDSEYIKNYI